MIRTMKTLSSRPAILLPALILSVLLLGMAGALPLAHNHAPNEAGTHQCPAFILSILFSSILINLTYVFCFPTQTEICQINIHPLESQGFSVSYPSRAPPVVF